MAGIKLDNAGVQKMKTLDEALVMTQRLHSVVELYALNLKQGKPTSLFGMQVKRALYPLVGFLKPQFGMISDQAAALNLIATRGGSEVAKIRYLREGVAAIKQALEIAMVRVKDNHAVIEEPKPGARKPGE